MLVATSARPRTAKPMPLLVEVSWKTDNSTRPRLQLARLRRSAFSSFNVHDHAYHLQLNSHGWSGFTMSSVDRQIQPPADRIVTGSEQRASLLVRLMTGPLVSGAGRHR